MAWAGFIVGTWGIDNVDPIGVTWAFPAEFAHDCKATNVFFSCGGGGFGYFSLLLRPYAINEEMRMRGYETRDDGEMYMNRMETTSGRTVNMISVLQRDLSLGNECE
jgi:hypothetical protein